MALMLDNLGERYGKLPSEVLETATTFDLQMFDIAVKHRNKEMRKASGDYNINEEYTQQELQTIMEQTRGRTKT